ncbi:MAG TPA: hypothetical protein VFQ60_00825 [Patescibacteria group bacterium]|nr:hypothetical protein [Patescibacteria group bacterium]
MERKILVVSIAFAFTACGAPDTTNPNPDVPTSEQDDNREVINAKPPIMDEVACEGFDFHVSKQIDLEPYVIGGNEQSFLFAAGGYTSPTVLQSVDHDGKDLVSKVEVPDANGGIWFIDAFPNNRGYGIVTEQFFTDNGKQFLLKADAEGRFVNQSDTPNRAWLYTGDRGIIGYPTRATADAVNFKFWNVTGTVPFPVREVRRTGDYNATDAFYLYAIALGHSGSTNGKMALAFLRDQNLKQYSIEVIVGDGVSASAPVTLISYVPNEDERNGSYVWPEKILSVKDGFLVFWNDYRVLESPHRYLTWITADGEKGYTKDVTQYEDFAAISNDRIAGIRLDGSRSTGTMTNFRLELMDTSFVIRDSVLVSDEVWNGSLLAVGGGDVAVAHASRSGKKLSIYRCHE